MPADKISVSLPSDLVSDLEALALKDGLSRSFVIQEASARYVAVRKAQDREASRRASVGTALEGFEDIAATWGQDPRQGIEYLAELRFPTELSGDSGTTDND